MKNIIVVFLLLAIPVCAYLFLNKNNTDYVAVANDKNNPSLLIYTSTMCLDCKKMKEIIKDVESEYSDKINFISINALDNDKQIQESIKKHNVQVVPTLVFTDINGKQTDKIEGYIPKDKLLIKLEKTINE